MKKFQRRPADLVQGEEGPLASCGWRRPSIAHQRPSRRPSFAADGKSNLGFSVGFVTQFQETQLRHLLSSTDTLRPPWLSGFSSFAFLHLAGSSSCARQKTSYLPQGLPRVLPLATAARFCRRSNLFYPHQQPQHRYRLAGSLPEFQSTVPGIDLTIILPFLDAQICIPRRQALIQIVDTPKPPPLPPLLPRQLEDFTMNAYLQRSPPRESLISRL